MSNLNNSAILEFQSFDMESELKDSKTLIDMERSGSVSSGRRSHSPDITDKPRQSSQSFWTFQYYQQFFDVDTDEVKERIIWSMVPRLRKNFLETYIKPNPDLYGPVWICITLIFTIGVSGNIANYLQYATEANYHWHYDFHLISYAATAILTYVTLVPVALYMFIKWNSHDVPLSFLELLCTYGYSLSIYVPTSMLSTIQVSWLQWGLILLAATASCAVLVISVTPSLSGQKKLGVLVMMVALHYLLAVGFMLYFFHAPDYFTPSQLAHIPSQSPPHNVSANSMSAPIAPHKSNISVNPPKLPS